MSIHCVFSRFLPVHRLFSCRLLQVLALCGYLALGTGPLQAADIRLPELGDASSAIVSHEKEYKLGQTWLRIFRSQVPTFSDPLIITYLEELLARLAPHSQLKSTQLELIVVKNPTMNAFAVPGGVVGVHTGLFLQAESEHQLASVLSHELAHLSQRHFARGVERQRNTSTPTMAAMLASLIIAATAGGDAGIAAITATQAAALDARLKFSRQNEQEADRIGMLNLVNAGLDPYAVPKMFEQMLRATRYSRRPPEFLLTHPVTESRIADASNRANKYPRRQYIDPLDYHLLRARAQLLHESNPQVAVKRFQSELEGDSLSRDASRYGLVLALINTSQLAKAKQNLAPLLKKHPNQPIFKIAEADIATAAGDLNRALELLKQQLQQRRNYYPLRMRYAETLLKARRYDDSEKILVALSRQRPKDDLVWYLLAEVHGLAGNILGVHEARAEYFILNGVYDKALKQLKNALKLAKDSFHKTALLEERIKDVHKAQEKAKL